MDFVLEASIDFGATIKVLPLANIGTTVSLEI